jgi:hypothetical protein
MVVTVSSLKMDKKRLEFYLNRKNTFGYNTEDNEKIVGWILLRKRIPNTRFFEIVEEVDDPIGYRKQMKIKREPYSVWIAQVTRETFESDRFPSNEDYLLNVSYTFSNLDDVEGFLREMGYDLANIKWGADLSFL